MLRHLAISLFVHKLKSQKKNEYLIMSNVFRMCIRQVGKGEKEGSARFTVVNSFGCDIPLAKPSETRSYTHTHDRIIIHFHIKREEKGKDPLHLEEK
jgi:hypothetical protein